ncbi:MAG: 7,8-dihydroneopterin aldolase/epimerase/oxygenase [bacterium]|jgi:dihydroneopterin aldolase
MESRDDEERDEVENDEYEDADDQRVLETAVTVEINGLSLYTHVGVTAAEREVGQRLILDIRLELGDAAATVTDAIDDTVDYGRVCEVAALVATQRSDKTLERLCAAVADRLMRDFDAAVVSVKASKPEPPIPLPVEDVAVEVWRELVPADDDDD